MALTAGIGGSVKNGANTIANLNTWTVNPKGNVVKTTPFGASGNWDTNIATIKNWTATFDGNTDPADTLGQLALMNGLNSTFTFTFSLGGTTNWAGTGILTGMTAKADVGGVNTISFNVDGTGPLTFTP